ncbi:MAG: adenosylcobinamide-GDP ribazoletransferase [Pseudomonadota bacterium]
MTEALRHLALAFQFLTRLPLPADLGYSEERMARALYHFATVGLCIGLALGAVHLALLQIFEPLLAAILTLAASIRLTGAFHEDGLGDLADGLGGSPDRERALEIMRDSRLGTYGTVALIIVLAAKAAGLAELAPWAAVAAIIGGHTLGRAAIVLIVRWSRYARPEGVGAFTKTTVPATALATPIAASLLALACLAWAASPLAAAVSLIAVACVAAFMLRYMLRRLDGYTGDGLGTVETLSELAVILAVAACL